MSISNYLQWKEQQKAPYNFVITGRDAYGKRFKAIHTNTPQGYNIYQGTLWQIVNGKRKKIKDYFN
jgi:hypothetical protein